MRENRSETKGRIKNAEVDLGAVVGQLRDRSSAKRRSAAKKLRKLADTCACPALLEALTLELGDQRTWETQYHLIMALGQTGCTAALPLIRELAQEKFWATMRQMAVGDAFVRLSRPSAADAAPVIVALEIAREHDPQVAAGAMRAVAMLRLKFGESTAEWLVKAVDEFGYDDLTFWTAAASAGWTGDAVRGFLERCLQSRQEWTREAAGLALKGEYKSYKPL